ncbi:26S protease regulatory subunit S10B -like protein B [Trichinella pseudospiralis]|uniref:26S protease regulatory subunit S10B-like protein B n=1 Tax=Trichinella pseudospiralis TaxID=6337 RepID=A0A0V0YGQ6_TRIPS|nr:26S protease regulatory subunit S10B -like protein B [Trichinella pseudospiralis]
MESNQRQIGSIKKALENNNNQNPNDDAIIAKLRLRLMVNYKQVKKLHMFKDKRDEVCKRTIEEMNDSQCQLDRMKIGTITLVAKVLSALDKRVLIKTSGDVQYLCDCSKELDVNNLKKHTRVGVDRITLTITCILPPEVNPIIYNMHTRDEDKKTNFSMIGGLDDEIRQIREVVELPMKNPELFKRVGVTPPKGVLLYGPPGTGKTMIARLVASQIDCLFLQASATTITDSYIGEAAKIVREIFAYAKAHSPCIIFLDEIDAIGCKRSANVHSSDREFIETMVLQILSQIDGFDPLGQVKYILATNRPDALDSALLRPGRIDRKIEIKLPNDLARNKILQIYTKDMPIESAANLEPLVKITEGFNGADLKNVATEAAMFAIRQKRKMITHDDLMKSARKIAEGKKIESHFDHNF